MGVTLVGGYPGGLPPNPPPASRCTIPCRETVVRGFQPDPDPRTPLRCNDPKNSKALLFPMGNWNEMSAFYHVMAKN